MAKFKFLVMASILSLATTVAMGGCGEDEEGCPDLVSCENVDECDNGACTDAECPDVYTTNLCVTACGADTDCAEDEVCAALCEGGATVCQPSACLDGAGGDGGGGDGGGGGDECEDNAECFAEGAYCSTEGCTDISCGTTINDCPRCLIEREANGPVIFNIEQVDNAPGNDAEVCRKDPACEDNGDVCKFRFDYELAPGASLPEDLYQEGVQLITAAGGLTDTFFRITESNGTLEFEGCFGGAVEGAVALVDAAGNQSNGLCFVGDKP